MRYIDLDAEEQGWLAWRVFRDNPIAAPLCYLGAPYEPPAGGEF
jgi:hypothetical protein